MTKRPIRLLTWLGSHEWAVMGFLALTAFVLGLVGMHRQQEGNPDVRWWADAVYFALRLFTFEYDLNGEGSHPYAVGNWPLQIARFLAPATLALATFKLVMVAVTQRYDLWRISRWKGHAVVCGAGERGRQLALALRSEGKNVVVIEKDEDCDTLADIREAGAIVVIGSATDPSRQTQAGFHSAAVVAAVTPCMESNLQVVLAASRRTNALPVRALAYAPRSFAAMFESQPPFASIEGGRECSFFDHDAAAARLLVRHYAPALVPALFHERRPPRILVAGDGNVVPELLGVLVTQCQYAYAGVPCIDLLTVNTDAIARTFPLLHPQMPLVVDLRIQKLSLSEMLRLEVQTSGLTGCREPYDLTFIACREDVDSLVLAQNLSQQDACALGHVVAGLRPSTQLIRLFTVNQPMPRVTLYDLVALGCSADIVLRGQLDEHARSMHESYLERQLESGRRYGETPALVPWNQLTDGLRQANRAQADHVPIKRRTLEIARSDETLEALAEAEHRRWMAEKIVAGWRHAVSRDDSRRLHPSIRPYVELSEEERNKDRNTVQNL